MLPSFRVGGRRIVFGFARRRHVLLPFSLSIHREACGALFSKDSGEREKLSIEQKCDIIKFRR